MRNLIPYAKHKNCIKYIYANRRKKHKGYTLKKWFWIACRAKNETDFNDAMGEISQLSLEAYNDFMEKGPQHFCKAYIKTWATCNMINNNMAETFNDYILEVRTKPLIYILKDIRFMVMQSLYAKKDLVKCQSDIDALCLKVQKKKVGRSKLDSRL